MDKSMGNTYLTDAKIQKNKNKTLLALSFSSFLAMICASILSLAIPIFTKELHISESLGENTISMYLLVLALSCLLFGKLTDKYGKKKIFNLGLLVLIGGSIIAGFAMNFIMLLFGRIIQAIGSAMVLSNNNAITTEIFPEDQRGKALGILGAFSIIGGIAGPSIGGIIVNYLDWHFIFWVIIPFILLSYFINKKIIPKDIYFSNETIDIKGLIIIFIGLLSLYAAITLGGFIGYTSILFYILLIIAIIFIFAFIKFEMSKQNQLFQFYLFKNINFSIGLISAFIIYGVTYFYTVPMPLYLQDDLDLSAQTSSLLFLIFPLVMSALSPFTGMLADRYSKKILIIIGLIILLISQLLFLLVHAQSSIIIFIINSILMGMGMSLFQTPNNTMVMSVGNNYNLGSVGSLKAFAQNFGRFIGIVFSTTFLYLAMSLKDHEQVDSYLPNQPNIFIFGMHVTFLISFALCLITLGLSIFLFIKTRNKPSQ